MYRQMVFFVFYVYFIKQHVLKLFSLQKFNILANEFPVALFGAAATRVSLSVNVSVWSEHPHVVPAQTWFSSKDKTPSCYIIKHACEVL